MSFMLHVYFEPCEDEAEILLISAESSVSLVVAKDTLKTDVQAARRASHRKWLGQFLLGFSPHCKSCEIYYRLVARIKNYIHVMSEI